MSLIPTFLKPLAEKLAGQPHGVAFLIALASFAFAGEVLVRSQPEKIREHGEAVAECQRLVNDIPVELDRAIREAFLEHLGVPVERFYGSHPDGGGRDDIDAPHEVLELFALRAQQGRIKPEAARALMAVYESGVYAEMEAMRRDAEEAGFCVERTGVLEKQVRINDLAGRGLLAAGTLAFVTGVGLRVRRRDRDGSASALERWRQGR